MHGHLVRPHDIEISHEAVPGSLPATVTRVVRLGFEARVEMRTGEAEASAQVTRNVADELNLEPGTAVHIRVHPAANTVPAA
jgi:sulfate transport system ATP-binding protein